MADFPVTDSVPVRFCGAGTGCGPLTWGQKQVFLEMRESGQTLNMADAQPMPRPVPVGEVAAQFAEMISRHPSLRTRFPAHPEAGAEQVVSESGELSLDVVDLADSVSEDDAVNCVNDLWHSQLLTPFDQAQDWPIKMAVVTRHGLARYWVWTLNHPVADGLSMAILQGELGYGVSAGRFADPTAMGMLELARLERTPRLQAVNDRSMRYWESQLERVPPLTFGLPRYPGRQGERFWHGQFNSVAAYLAAIVIAQKTQTDTSRVLLTLMAIALGRATGVCPLTVKFIVNNRYRPGYKEVMAPLSQSVPVTVDVSGASVEEAIARTRRAVTVGAMHGYFDPDRVTELMGELDARRGYQAQLTCHINDPRVHVRVAAEEAVRTREITAREIEEALDQTWFSWDGIVPGGFYTDQTFITIIERPETMLLQLVFDTESITEAQAEGMTHEFEQVAMRAAADPGMLTDVTPGQAQY
jgi:hypothetical protein